MRQRYQVSHGYACGMTDAEVQPNDRGGFSATARVAACTVASSPLGTTKSPGTNRGEALGWGCLAVQSVIGSKDDSFPTGIETPE
jgi:hypothetical protein